MIRIIWILLFEQFKGLFNNKKNFIKNTASKLARINILYIKIFQALSNSHDKLTESDKEHLRYYTENAPYTRDELDLSNLMNCLQEFNISLCSLMPIASGMISVVYEGIDNASGMKVAIKYKRKNIREKVIKDFNKMLPLINFVDKFTPLNIKDIVEENRELLINQTDFKNEVKNIKKYQAVAEDCEIIKIPFVYDNITNKYDNIIVMEYIVGLRLPEVNEESKKLYVENFSKIIAKCLLFHRLFHGDLHQGNIIFLNNGRIGLIDFGIVGEMTRIEQDIYFRFFKYLARRNFNDMGRLALKELIQPQELVNTYSEEKQQIIINCLSDFFKSSLENEKRLSYTNLCELGVILKKYNLELSKNFCKLELSLGSSDGVMNCLSGEDNPIIHINTSMEELIPKDILELLD